MEPRHIVWITLDKGLFSARYGFDGAAEFGGFIHEILVGILEATKLSDDETQYNTDFRSVQIGTYKEGSNGQNKRYHVPPSVAECFYKIAASLRQKVVAFNEQKEAAGKNILLQMLKSDILGEALS